MSVDEAIAALKHKINLHVQGRSGESPQLYDAINVLIREIEGPKELKPNYRWDAWWPDHDAVRGED